MLDRSAYEAAGNRVGSSTIIGKRSHLGSSCRIQAALQIRKGAIAAIKPGGFGLQAAAPLSDACRQAACREEKWACALRHAAGGKAVAAQGTGLSAATVERNAACGAIGEKIGDPDQGLPSNDRSLFNLEFLVQSACEATISDMARQDEPRRIASPASAWRFLRLLAPATRRSDAVDLMPAVVRGTRLHLPRHDIPRRFIPARAGNA